MLSSNTEIVEYLHLSHRSITSRLNVLPSSDTGQQSSRLLVQGDYSIRVFLLLLVLLFFATFQ